MRRVRDATGHRAFCFSAFRFYLLPVTCLPTCLPPIPPLCRKSVAVTLAWVTHGLLIGESASPDDQREAQVLAESTPGVLAVTQLLTMHLGPDVVILALKVAFDPELRLAEIEAVTNTMEERLRAKLPHMRKIFIEADSAGDGRGTLREGKLPNPPSTPRPGGDLTAHEGA